MQVTNGPSREAIDDVEVVLEELQSVVRALTRTPVHERVLSDLHVRIDRSALLVLHKLQHAGGLDVRVTDLAHLVGVEPPAITRKVQQLERAGLVTRAEDERDRRVVRISLTPAGAELFARARASYRDLLVEVMAAWPRSDVRRFADLLERFSTGLSREVEE